MNDFALSPNMTGRVKLPPIEKVSGSGTARLPEIKKVHVHNLVLDEEEGPTELEKEKIEHREKEVSKEESKVSSSNSESSSSIHQKDVKINNAQHISTFNKGLLYIKKLTSSQSSPSPFKDK